MSLSSYKKLHEPGGSWPRRAAARELRVINLLPLSLLFLSGVATAQLILKDPENTASVPRANPAVSAPASNDTPHLQSLEDEAARLWAATAEEPTAQTRRVEFYRGLQSFVGANPRFAVSPRYERLLQEVLAVMEADQRRRRVRTVDDVFAVAAERLRVGELPQAAQLEWGDAVKRFLADHPIYEADRVLLDALDATVRMLANDPKNVNRDARWLLEEAHSGVRSKFTDRMTPVRQNTDAGANAPR